MNIQEKKEALKKENEELRNQFMKAQQLIKAIQERASEIKGGLKVIEEIEKDAKDTGNTDVVS